MPIIGIASSTARRSELAVHSARKKRIGPRVHPLATWIILTGIFLPPVQVFIGSAKFTPGRLVVFLLLVPALVQFVRRGAKLIASDFLICATGAWMIAAAPFTASTYAEVIEIAGAYAVGRAYFFGLPAVETFIRVFKPVTIALIALAVLESLSGRRLVQDATAEFFAIFISPTQYRGNFLRAASTFDIAELYGTFCAIAAAIFLYSERDLWRRSLYVVLCSFGCLLSLSSGPLNALTVVLSLFCYDYVMKRYSWRWIPLIAAVAGLVLFTFVAFEHPIGNLVSLATLDPSTGYFRIATWNSSIKNITLSPWFGYGFSDYGNPNDYFAHHSVDCVWLVEALRFGVPTAILLFLTLVGSILPFSVQTRRLRTNTHVNRLSMGFTLVIVTLAIIGLTVHYWNGLWIFWGLCIGVRGSLKELSLGFDNPRHFGLPRTRPVRNSGPPINNHLDA